MKNIVMALLEEGIDEQMVHRILDLIEEETLSRKAQKTVVQLSDPKVGAVNGNNQTKLYTPDQARQIASTMDNHYNNIKNERKALQKRGKEIMKERSANAKKEEISQPSLFGGN